MQPLEAVLFDLDGTLVDSKPDIVASMQRAFVARGLPPPAAEEIEIGAPLLEIVAGLLQQHGQEHHAEVVRIFRADYNATGVHLSKPFPGVPVLLERLRQRGLRLYVATSKSEVFARPMLETLGLAPFFSRIYGAELNGQRTNKVELIGYVLQREGLAANVCAMVGDRSFDMLGATANGLLAVGVTWGYGSPEELRSNGAQALVASTDELFALVEQRTAALSAAS